MHLDNEGKAKFGDPKNTIRTNASYQANVYVFRKQQRSKQKFLRKVQWQRSLSDAKIFVFLFWFWKFDLVRLKPPQTLFLELELRLKILADTKQVFEQN